MSVTQRDRFTSHLSIRHLCAGLVAVLLVGGCTMPPMPPDSATDDATYKEWKQLAQAAAWNSPPAPNFPPALDIHDSVATYHPFDFEESEPLPQIAVKNMVLTRDMDVGVLLRALADAADLNVLISNDVSGPIRVSLRRETRWDRLFLAITEARGYHYDLQGDLLSVYSLQDVQSKIAMESALHEQLEASERRMRSEPTQVSMVRIHYADLDSLAEAVRSTMYAKTAAGNPAGEGVLPPLVDNQFTVQANKDTGQLILHGVPADISRARKMIAGLDQPTYQILIEATIVQANNDVARELGVQWGLYGNPGNFMLGTTPRPDGFNSNFPAGFDPADSGFTYGVNFITGSTALQAQLSALQEDGRLNIISRPSITTLDQLPATIESGEERPFASAAGTGIATVSQIEFKKAALRLQVTPHVIDTNWVKLDIETTKDDFDDTRPIIIDGNVQLPILTRSAETALYLANGQTTVIGGLSSETKSRQEGGIPLLKDIPGLGAAFRSQADRNAFSDTLIFITPHILPKVADRLAGSK
ncbi:secretin N-terminal domain-containing protein [Haloferula helveola]